MSLNQEERNAVVSLEYEKAYSTFCNIPTLVENEMWDFVADYNCAYKASKEDILPYVSQVEYFIKKIRMQLTALDI